MNKIWAYIIGRELTDNELEQFDKDGKAFVKQWTAHDQPLDAGFSIFEKRIALVSVNEGVHNASGCSIDKLLRFVKESEQKYSTELLNRMLVALRNENKVSVIPSSKIKELILQGKINENTAVFNTSLSNDAELGSWEQPLKQTWLKKYLSA